MAPEGRFGRFSPDCWHSIIFILPTLEIVSGLDHESARDTPLGHLSRAVPFSKIRVYIGMKWAKEGQEMLKRTAHQPEFGNFSPSGNTLLAISTWISEKVARQKICSRFSPQRHLKLSGFLDSHEPTNHHGYILKREWEGRDGQEMLKRTAHQLIIRSYCTIFGR